MASRARRTIVWVAALAAAIVTEATGSGLQNPSQWLPDLVVGMALITAGLLRPDGAQSRTPVLLVAAGGTWFVGTLFPAAIYLHRGLLAHAALTFPGWRPNRFSVVAVGVAYLSAIVMSLASSDGWTIVLGIILVAAAWANHARARGRARIERLVALQATAAFAVVLLGSVLIRSAIQRGDGVYPALVLYEVGIVAIAAYLFVALRSPAELSVTDLVVELGNDSGGTLRDRLSSLLGDPSLEVGYWTGNGYVDTQGERVEVPTDEHERSTTPVSLEGRPFAVIVHDRGVLGDRSSIDAVERATRLSDSNVQLRARVAAAVADIEGSTRRLLLAADAERDRLAVRLASGPEQTLATLVHDLGGVSPAIGASRAGHLNLSIGHLETALHDLHEVGRGLRPGELEAGSLRDMLAGLARRTTVPVLLDVRVDNAPSDVRATVYYVCAEGLANVTKHAAATSARVDVSSDGPMLVVEIVDEGRGGADERRGTGLAGMRDRLAAIGGTLEVTSPAGAGTRLVARLPLDHEAR